MSPLFPHHTVEWKLEEPAAFRRLTLSLVGMAAVTGVVLRLVRMALLTHVGSSWLAIGGAYALIAVVLCLGATVHLSNYPVRQWLWRTPAFLGVDVAAEMITSLALIAAGREMYGSSRAAFHDWPQLAGSTLLYRFVVLATFTLALAAVVQVVRFALLKVEHREATLAAVHEERVRAEEQEAARGS